MKKAVFLHIPTPCHENWKNMNPAEQGRFCMSCSKTVIDFSNKSDGEILSILSKASANTCGRFSGTQLQRPMTAGSMNVRTPYKFILPALIPALLFFNKVISQSTKGEVQVNVESAPPEVILLGKVQFTEPACKKPDTIKQALVTLPNIILLTGKVVDENGDPVPYASVGAGAPGSGTTCDSAGNFKFKLANTKPAVLSISAAGFKPTQNSINPVNDNNRNLTITLERTAMLPEVVVVAYGDQYRTIQMGGLAVVRTVSMQDTLKTMLSRLTGSQMFNAYPNPAAAGSAINITFKQPGSFSIQLFNNSGALFLLQDINIPHSLQAETMLIPVSIAPGIYYIRATQKGIQKSYTSKLIIK